MLNELTFSSSASLLCHIATARTRHRFRPPFNVGVDAWILRLKLLNGRLEGFGVGAYAFRLTQCEMDCRYDGPDCVPIRVSKNGFDVHHELSEA